MPEMVLCMSDYVLHPAPHLEIVHGMGGVGKTTIVKEVGQLATELMLVEELAFAVVSRVPNVRKIQGEIAKLMLGLKC
ncbi:NB-ARC [Dillenia turbinata]|uniref:NB-ARC n=1 Tax=Dillenia turbinata TaxID=194707 RepID=A0AAN8UN65_9MAGN